MYNSFAGDNNASRTWKEYYDRQKQQNSGGGGYDDTALVKRVKALEDAQHAAYDDSALRSMVNALQTECDDVAAKVDSIEQAEQYDDSAVKADIAGLQRQCETLTTQIAELRETLSGLTFGPGGEVSGDTANAIYVEIHRLQAEDENIRNDLVAKYNNLCDRIARLE